MQSVYQYIYIILRPYFVQDKCVPHTNNSPPPRGPTTPPSLGTSAVNPLRRFEYESLFKLILLASIQRNSF
jgi:hypothetical protein